MTIEESKKWFKEAKYGLMVHWGLYALLGGEYKGKRMDYIGEWIMSKYEIPNEENEVILLVDMSDTTEEEAAIRDALVRDIIDV